MSISIDELSVDSFPTVEKPVHLPSSEYSATEDWLAAQIVGNIVQEEGVPVPR